MTDEKPKKQKGGARPGSGRKPKDAEPTILIRERIPARLENNFKEWLETNMVKK